MKILIFIPIINAENFYLKLNLTSNTYKITFLIHGYKIQSLSVFFFRIRRNDYLTLYTTSRTQLSFIPKSSSL